MATKQAHIVVRGRVQGVFFRVHTKEVAESLNLTGWVKNRPDGSVEIVAEGGNVESLINWCHEGPPSSNVEDVSVNYNEPKNEFNAFEIKY